jgi:small subunit ribosomal protein S8
MSHTDPIADMLTRLRNANKALHAQVAMPSSVLKVELARVLKDEGYIAGYSVQREGSFDTLVVELKYTDGRRRVISQVKRVSKPGRRIYAKKDNLPKVLGGMGTAVISTSRGLMTAREAQRLGVGGEVVCFVW